MGFKVEMMVTLRINVADPPKAGSVGVTSAVGDVFYLSCALLYECLDGTRLLSLRKSCCSVGGEPVGNREE